MPQHRARIQGLWLQLGSEVDVNLIYRSGPRGRPMFVISYGTILLRLGQLSLSLLYPWTLYQQFLTTSW